MLTPDVESANTYKRAIEFSKYFLLTITGFRRAGVGKNVRLVSGVRVLPVGEIGDGNYLSRVKLYIQMLKLLQAEKADFLWARGSDMLFLALIHKFLLNRRTRVLAEIIDIYDISFRKWFSPFFRLFEKILLRSTEKVFVTSPAFFRFYDIPSSLQMNWENQLPYHYSKEHLLERFRFKHELLQKNGYVNITQSGYLRCQNTLKGMAWVAARHENQVKFHIHGFAHGGGFTDAFLNELEAFGNQRVLFHGKYKFPEDLERIFAASHFTIVSEKHWMNMDGTLNLTNRIYESMANCTPCIAVGSGAVYDYVRMHRLGLVFETFEEVAQFFATLTPTAYEKIFMNVDFEGFNLKILEMNSRVRLYFSSISGTNLL